MAFECLGTKRTWSSAERPCSICGVSQSEWPRGVSKPTTETHWGCKGSWYGLSARTSASPPRRRLAPRPPPFRTSQAKFEFSCHNRTKRFFGSEKRNVHGDFLFVLYIYIFFVFLVGLTIKGGEFRRPKSPSAFVGRLDIAVAVWPLLLFWEKKRFFFLLIAFWSANWKVFVKIPPPELEE